MTDRPTRLAGRIRNRTRLGEMLRLYRAVRGLSLRDVAPVIGIGHATLMRIEVGESFDVATCLKLWTYLLAEEPSLSPAPTAREGS